MENKGNLLLDIYKFVCVQGKFLSLSNPKAKETSEEIYNWINSVTEQKPAVKQTSRSRSTKK